MHRAKKYNVLFQPAIHIVPLKQNRRMTLFTIQSLSNGLAKKTSLTLATSLFILHLNTD